MNFFRSCSSSPLPSSSGSEGLADNFIIFNGWSLSFSSHSSTYIYIYIYNLYLAYSFLSINLLMFEFNSPQMDIPPQPQPIIIISNTLIEFRPPPLRCCRHFLSEEFADFGEMLSCPKIPISRTSR